MIAIEETIIDDLIKERDILDKKIEDLENELTIVKNKYENSLKLNNEIVKKLEENESKSKKIELEIVELTKENTITKEEVKKKNFRPSKLCKGYSKGRVVLLQSYKDNGKTLFKILS